jgi:hypothetical protein
MKRNTRITAVALVAAFMGTTLIAPLAANASEEGRRNTAYALGAASVALLLTQKNKLPGILAGAGAVYAYGELQKDISKRHQEERAWAYRNDYRRGHSEADYHRTPQSKYHRHDERR